MIRELVEYAQTHGLTSKPGYTRKAVKWAIDIDPNGRYLGVTALGDPSVRNHPGIVFPEAPHLEQPELIAGGQSRCHFLIETVAVVTNWPDEKGKNTVKHQSFLQLLAEAKPVIPELAAWERCLQDPGVLERIRADLKNQRGKPTDRITVRMAGRFLVERTDWHSWWDAYRRSLLSGDVSVGACLVTGENGPIAQTHPKIMGLAAVGGNSAGSALVSFDKDAFSSFGLVQGQNAAIGERVAVAYQSALNDLIQRGLTLSGIRVVYWYREPVSVDQDLLAFLGQPREEDRERQALVEARKGLLQVLTGDDSVATTTNRFYVLLLSGVAGRVMVRAWYEGAYDDLRKNIIRWFEDLEMVRPDGGLARLPAFYALLRQLSVRKDEEIPAPDVRGLWEAAVFHRSIPLAIARRGLDRIRHDLVTGEMPHPDVMAIMKSYLIRNKGGIQVMDRALNPNRPEVSYQLGRLLAIMDQLYAADDRDARGLLASRYFRAASTTPLVVFGRLLGLAEYYLARVEPEKLKQWFRNHLMEVTNRISTIPRTLSFEDQAIFSLGYYHQMAQLRGKNGEES